MITISISSIKGGVGKTTTALAFASGLVNLGYRVLCIDTDGQCNFTTVVCAEPPEVDLDDIIAGPDAATGKVTHIEDCIVRSKYFGDIVACNKNLQGSLADKRYPEMDKIFCLKDELDRVRGKYDFCIIDTPPGYGLMLITAVTASDYLVLPALASTFSIKGTDDIIRHATGIKRFNPSLKIAGILICMDKKNTKMSKSAASSYQYIAESIGSKCFSTSIRHSVNIEKAHATHRSIYSLDVGKYKINSVAEDYRKALDELISTINT